MLQHVTTATSTPHQYLQSCTITTISAANTTIPSITITTTTKAISPPHYDLHHITTTTTTTTSLLRSTPPCHSSRVSATYKFHFGCSVLAGSSRARQVASEAASALCVLLYTFPHRGWVSKGDFFFFQDEAC
ncbi:hypothetical protein E2C01_089898 [Portunus trituberculatus]|uniref:Uncharacterized protein n=1 Tax=Portunus trituberculatus TaxID=210409 RepID=A0A5B7JNP2_PORTR|nr:hypothetical protein [Portunus trituberculatus]